MAKGKEPAAKTGKLVAHNFLPTLSKPAHVNGDVISMQGKDWADRCASGGSWVGESPGARR